jgi:hypothetical protein
VDQDQVQVVELRLLKGGLEAVDSVLVAEGFLLGEDLGGKEDVLALDAGSSQSLGALALVVVRGRGVDLISLSSRISDQFALSKYSHGCSPA